MTPESDCDEFKFTMEKIQQLDILIQCHNKLLHCKQDPMMKSHTAKMIMETMAQKDQLVSKLWTLLPCTEPDSAPIILFLSSQ
ncbi:hypothetical protein TNIN_462101 [Trichonephila inaurata madagascariensis]|uniref:Uncharacterized protein n=1 Tax=Trichonephila inaurata madagascariensis TaxID=2747483 RepID=A0A8X6WP14_9ARAC|nr:hypothetical protein TNIN_462101 [Trichonephila inaurata madagascariensis]